MVLQLWDDTPDQPPLEDWRSEEALSGMPERNGARVASVILLVVALVAMIAAVSFVFGAGSSAREELVQSASSLVATVETFDASAAGPNFGPLDAGARQVLDAAQQLDVGDPDRAVAIDASGRVLEGERALSEALAYQTGFVVFVGRPSLPTATDDLSAISAEYTTWLTSLTGVLEPTPDEPTFDGHRQLIDDFISQSTDLQSRYLDSLRAGDAGSAAGALAELDTQVAALETSVTESVDAARVAFSATLDEARTMLGRIGAER